MYNTEKEAVTKIRESEIAILTANEQMLFSHSTNGLSVDLQTTKSKKCVP